MAQPAPKYPVDLATETPAEREARLAWELERIAEGDADLAAGRYIGGEEALDWLDRWTAGEELEDPKLD
jgi:predicted transcriptional regulator